jgi:D-amino-acid dehydrogenase
MHIAVLGGGVIGVTTAWYLRAAGHLVTLIDRQTEVGLETSFANGAQLSAGHAEPWAQPGAISKLLKWLPREDAPLLFRLRLDPDQWRWGLAFLNECRPSRFTYNLRQILALGVYSRQQMITLRAQTGIRFDSLSKGILNVYEDRADFSRAQEITALIRSYGYQRGPISIDEALIQEPSLAHRRASMVGATWTPPDETGDAYLFCRELARVCEQAGVVFKLGQSVERIVVRHGQVKAVVMQPVQHTGSLNMLSFPSDKTEEANRLPTPIVSSQDEKSALENQTLAVDACVVAMGSYSARLLQGVGVRIPVYPAKGYSATMQICDDSAAPRASVTDEAYKMVFTRLGDRLRIAGTAEFNGYEMDLNHVRCHALIARARTLFPEAAEYHQPSFWTGLRPATPSNRPLIGATRIEGLYLNTGHGTLGWTEACGSSHAISLLIDGKQPDVEFDFLNV